MLKNKKGVMQQLGALGVGIAGLAITLVIAMLIITTGKTQGGTIGSYDPTNATQCAANVGCTASDTLMTATAGIPGRVGIIVIGVVGAILLGIVGLYTSRNK